jgi:hypothetical protein
MKVMWRAGRVGVGLRAERGATSAEFVLGGLGVAAVAGLGWVLVTTRVGFLRLAALNVLVALLFAAAASAVDRWVGRGRAAAPGVRRGARWLGQVLGQAATGVVLACGVCVVAGLGFGLVMAGPHDIGAGLFAGGLWAVPAAVLVGIPIGLAAGLVTGCTRSRAIH